MFEDVKYYGKSRAGYGELALREEVGWDAILNKVVRVDLIEEG